MAESVDVLLPHEARSVRLNDPALTGAYSFWLAHMYTPARRSAAGRASSAHRAIDAAARAGDTATVGKAHGVLALDGHWSGNAAEGIAPRRGGRAHLSAHPDQRWWLGMAHFYLAMNHLLAGNFEAASRPPGARTRWRTRSATRDCETTPDGRLDGSNSRGGMSMRPSQQAAPASSMHRIA